MQLAERLQYTFQRSVLYTFIAERVPRCKMATAGIVRNPERLIYNLRNLRYVDGVLVEKEIDFLPLLTLRSSVRHFAHREPPYVARSALNYL